MIEETERSRIEESRIASRISSIRDSRLEIRGIWNPKFRVGDVVRTVGGGGSYSRGEVVEAMREEKYYRVDYGRGFPSLIREENLEVFDEGNPLSKPPRSFAPPVVPFM